MFLRSRRIGRTVHAGQLNDSHTTKVACAVSKRYHDNGIFSVSLKAFNALAGQMSQQNGASSNDVRARQLSRSYRSREVAGKSRTVLLHCYRCIDRPIFLSRLSNDLRFVFRHDQANRESRVVHHCLALGSNQGHRDRRHSLRSAVLLSFCCRRGPE